MQFPSSPRPLYEVKCSAFDMEMICHSHTNKTHFHKKGSALGLILKVRVFETRKGPIGLLTNLKHGAHIHQSRPGQCFTHAHSRITRAVEAMDSCFALIGAHQHDCRRVYERANPRRVQSTPLSVSSTQRLWELLAGNRTTVLQRRARS